MLCNPSPLFSYVVGMGSTIEVCGVPDGLPEKVKMQIYPSGYYSVWVPTFRGPTVVEILQISHCMDSVKRKNQKHVSKKKKRRKYGMLHNHTGLHTGQGLENFPNHLLENESKVFVCMYQ